MFFYSGSSNIRALRSKALCSEVMNLCVLWKQENITYISFSLEKIEFDILASYEVCVCIKAVTFSGLRNISLFVVTT